MSTVSRAVRYIFMQFLRQETVLRNYSPDLSNITMNAPLKRIFVSSQSD